jgi:hypothetical protein
LVLAKDAPGLLPPSGLGEGRRGLARPRLTVSGFRQLAQVLGELEQKQFW